MDLKRIADMQRSFGGDVSGVRFFSGLEVSKVSADSANLYLGNDVPTAQANTKQSRLAVFGRASSIFLICGCGHVSKIHERVITWVAVNMVNFMLRPLALHVEPCEAVRSIIFLVDANCDAAIKASKMPNATPATMSPESPCEIASCRIVMQKFAQTFWGNLISSHAGLHIRSVMVRSPTSFARCGASSL